MAAGTRISVAEKAGYELYLTRVLRHATLVKVKGFAAAMELFNAGGADALASLKPSLLDATAQMPAARMLPGTFMTVNHGLGTPRPRPLAAQYLKSFVEDLNASGFVAASIARHQVKGLAAVGAEGCREVAGSAATVARRQPSGPPWTTPIAN